MPALLAGGCRDSVSGEIHDAASGRPIAGARVELIKVGLGMREGKLVKDKLTAVAVTTDQDGSFKLDGVSGGLKLSVTAPRFRRIETPLCSRSPMTVRIGGPFDRADLEKILRLGVGADGIALGWRFGPKPGTATLEMADLSVERLPTSGMSSARLRSRGGLFLVRGTGNPSKPPATGYVKSLDVDLFECGWLFVRTTDSEVAAVRIGSFSLDDLDGGHYLSLSYGLLNAA